MYYLHSVVQLADGRLCSCSADKTIKLWSAVTGQCEDTFTDHAGFAR